MRSRLSSIISLTALLPLMTPLNGCASVLAGLGGTRGTAIVCTPHLDPPPEAAIDALAAASDPHPEVGRWIVSLEKHYQAQDACEAKR